MPLDIKICGLRTEEAVDAALAGGATHLGFIFFPKSPRLVEPALAGQLRHRARDRASAVAVTVDASDLMLDRIVAAMQPDVIQMHGHEEPRRVAEVKARYGLPVMKAFAVGSATDLASLEAFGDVADWFLLDAKPPAGSELPGGNGIAFDWSLVRSVDFPAPYFLSGGLNPGNVGEALRLADPPGLDVSSGVESSPGVKDVTLIEAFFAAVRAARSTTA